MAGDVLQEVIFFTNMIALYKLCDEPKRGVMLTPDLERRFNEFYQAAYADGELDSKTKVLIGLAVAMTQGCYP